VVEARRFLQLAFDAVGYLLERVADRGARPLGLHHHGLDREVRVLAAPEPEVGPDARDHDDEHEIGHQGTVPKRPFGEVEALHQTAPRSSTFWPGRSVCTPAVTTRSPVSSPCEITTVAGSWRRMSTSRRETVLLCGSTTHTAGRPFASVSALAGTSTPGGAASLMRPVTVDPNSMPWGGSTMPTLTRHVRVAASASGVTCRT